MPATAAIISIVFAAAHYESLSSPSSLIRLFLISMALCYVRHRSGSVLACVIAHFLVNLLAVTIAAC